MEHLIALCEVAIVSWYQVHTGQGLSTNNIVASVPGIIQEVLRTTDKDSVSTLFEGDWCEYIEDERNCGLIQPQTSRLTPPCLSQGQQSGNCVSTDVKIWCKNTPYDSMGWTWKLILADERLGKNLRNDVAHGLWRERGIAELEVAAVLGCLFVMFH